MIKFRNSPIENELSVNEIEAIASPEKIGIEIITRNNIIEVNIDNEKVLSTEKLNQIKSLLASKGIVENFETKKTLEQRITDLELSPSLSFQSQQTNPSIWQKIGKTLRL